MSDGTPATTRATAPAAYAGYEAWKGWDKPFTFDTEQIDYFTGETRDLAIAGAEVLEIGFGSGAFIAWAGEKGARIAGTEINAAMLEAAKARGVELLASDFETIAEHHAGRFDTIMAFDVFEHFTPDEVRTRLFAAERMLKPGGQLLLRFPNSQSPFGLMCQAADHTHRSQLSQSTIEQLMVGTSFSVVRYGPSFRPRGHGFKRRVKRRLQYLGRDLIARTLNFVYASNIPWDWVVVLVLRKRG